MPQNNTTNPIVTALLAAVMSLTCITLVRADDKDTATDTGTRVVEVDTAKPGDLGSPDVNGELRHYITANKYPEGTKLRVTIGSLFDPSRGERFTIKVLTPLNAAGKPDGLEQYPHPWMGVLKTISYKDGLKDGPEKIFGQAGGKLMLRTEVPWKAGKIEGVRKNFHTNGNVANETPYADGVEQGEAKSFDEKGAITRTVKYEKGKRVGEMTDYWPGADKKQRVVPYADGKITGVVKEFYLDGKIKTESPFKDDRKHGVEKSYDTSGAVVSTNYWLNGEKVTKEAFEKAGK